MKMTFSAPVVTCRPALPRDTADVLEFTKFIWDGQDYIKYVWDEWMADSRGILVAAEYGGRCVGMAKVTFVSPGQWWYEGLRVSPEFQGLKIGSHLHEYIDRWWLEHGDGFARLMTSSKRVKVHHLCERLGYRRAAAVSAYHAPALTEALHSFRPVAEFEIKHALEFALRSPTLNLTGLMDTGWQQVRPDETILHEMVAAKKAYWWRQQKGLLLTRDDDEADEGARVTGLVLPACDLEALADLLLDARRLAAAQGCKQAFWIAPVYDSVISALDQAGFATDWEHEAFVYEKRHP